MNCKCKVTIHIGLLTDFTGLAAPAVKYNTFIIQDTIRYYNNENLIPGAKLKLEAYDTQFNPSRYTLGYDWCRDKGAHVIITLIPDAPLLLKSFAVRDKVVLAAMGATEELFTPPGWAFGFSDTTTSSAITLLHWIRENDWKGQGTPKLGMVYWNDSPSTDIAEVVKAYVDKTGAYELVDRITDPEGTTTFTTEAKKLKDEGCDYVALPSGMILGPVLRDLRAAGSKATLLDLTGSSGFTHMYVQMVGWDVLGGQYSWSTSFNWSDSSPFVDLAKTLLHKYHSASEAEDILTMSGNGYVGPTTQMVAILEVLDQAVKNVGAKNFNGQAYYDAALNYKTTSSMWAGVPEFSFSQTRRKLMDHATICEWKGGDVKDFVTITGWLPDVAE